MDLSLTKAEEKTMKILWPIKKGLDQRCDE
jgi:hypothetical protein